jgi:hypothetical protein
VRIPRAVFALAALLALSGFPSVDPARASTVVYDFRTPEAEAALSGAVAATFEVGGVPLVIQAGLLDEEGFFSPGDAGATLAVVVVKPQFGQGEGLGVLSEVDSGTNTEEALSRDEGLVFSFAPGFQPTRITFNGLTRGGTPEGGAFEAVRIFADGRQVLTTRGTPDGILTVPLPPGATTVGVTPTFDVSDGEPLSSDPAFFVTSIEGVTLLEVAFDVKPGSCTNPVNARSRGVIPAAILGTAELNPLAIDPSSVRLAGVPALRAAIEDVGGALGSCATARPDGRPDLVLKFDTQAIVRASESFLGPLRDGQQVVLPLAGRLYDGTKLVGEDVVVIRVPGKKR